MAMPMRPPVHRVTPPEAPRARSHPVYHSGRWQALRAAVLARDGHVCQLRLPGCTSRATIADHITLRGRGPDTESLNNLRAVCANCHNRRHHAATTIDYALATAITR
jgi:5-methylcytosine-specific restriction endonuclease McrA